MKASKLPIQCLMPYRYAKRYKKSVTIRQISKIFQNFKIVTIRRVPIRYQARYDLYKYNNCKYFGCRNTEAISGS